MDNKMEHRYVIADIGELNEFSPSSQASSATIPLHVHPGRRTMLKAGPGLSVAVTGAGTWLGLHKGAASAKQQTDNVVIHWNTIHFNQADVDGRALGNNVAPPDLS